MFELCLFDLDDTLVGTTDLKEVREAGKNDASPAYLKKLKAAVGEIDPRIYYPQALLENIRTEFPKLKLGVFTRAPRSYATCLLQLAYPTFAWDTIIAYEDVSPTKPYGKGIRKAMDEFNVKYLDRAVLVGDNDADVRSAYNCGCFVALDRSHWSKSWKDWEHDHWYALEKIPDAILAKPSDVLEFLKEPGSFFPELERAIAKSDRNGFPRFDEIGHFIPKDAGGVKKRYPIHIAGRSFANYDSTAERRKWHELTASIGENKEADTFPEEWVNTVRAFLAHHYPVFFGARRVKVCVVPHRPGRKPRLENFLQQLDKSLQAEPLNKLNVSIHPELLAYKEGVKSQHNDHLGALDRFMNVRDHLYVKESKEVAGGSAFLVIDDVTTTGASLIYASQYLHDAGATDVTCLSMSKNIGALYPKK
jgi:phosphoglycolate phosphatase-like HAD superfamily hydrolase